MLYQRVKGWTSVQSIPRLKLCWVPTPSPLSVWITAVSEECSAVDLVELNCSAELNSKRWSDGYACLLPCFCRTLQFKNWVGHSRRTSYELRQLSLIFPFLALQDIQENLEQNGVEQLADTSREDWNSEPSDGKRHRLDFSVAFVFVSVTTTGNVPQTLPSPCAALSQSLSINSLIWGAGVLGPHDPKHFGLAK